MLMLYGATGFTGGLIAGHIAREVLSGRELVLAGRSAQTLQRLADKLGCPTRAFDVRTASGQLDGVRVLLNTAGPFAVTQPPLLQACLQAGVHYMDIAGEVAEFQSAFAHDAKARERGVMLMPGAGFGVAPTDALALYLHRRLPNAHRLRLAFATHGGVSRGTLATVFENLDKPGVACVAAELRPERAARRGLAAPFAGGVQRVVSNPWRADLFSARDDRHRQCRDLQYLPRTRGGHDAPPAPGAARPRAVQGAGAPPAGGPE